MKQFHQGLFLSVAATIFLTRQYWYLSRRSLVNKNVLPYLAVEAEWWMGGPGLVDSGSDGGTLNTRGRGGIAFCPPPPPQQPIDARNGQPLTLFYPRVVRRDNYSPGIVCGSRVHLTVLYISVGSTDPDS
jgi:hypothetical protein